MTSALTGQKGQSRLPVKRIVGNRGICKMDILDELKILTKKLNELTELTESTELTGLTESIESIESFENSSFDDGDDG